MSARSLILAMLVLAGCSHAALPYAPDPQPRGARLSAAYRIVGDRLRIEIDTSGKPLEQAWIFTPDGSSVGPQAVEAPRIVTNPGPTIGIGMGGACCGRGVGVGSGAGIDLPVGGHSRRVEGNTIVWFPLASAGPPPWRLYVKVAGVEPTTFSVGGPLPS